MRGASAGGQISYRDIIRWMFKLCGVRADHWGIGLDPVHRPTFPVSEFQDDTPLGSSNIVSFFRNYDPVERGIFANYIPV